MTSKQQRKLIFFEDVMELNYLVYMINAAHTANNFTVLRGYVDGLHHVTDSF